MYSEQLKFTAKVLLFGKPHLRNSRGLEFVPRVSRSKQKINRAIALRLAWIHYRGGNGSVPVHI